MSIMSKMIKIYTLWDKNYKYTSSLIRHTLKDEKVSLCQLYSVLLSCLFFKFNIIPCLFMLLGLRQSVWKKIQVLIKFESRGPLPTRDKGVSTRPKQQGRFVRIFGPDQSNLKYDRFMILFFLYRLYPWGKDPSCVWY